MQHGYLNLVLHAHLPFVRHPNDSDPLEEDWLFEAITETYIPLLNMMNRLEREQVPFPLTLVLTPPLLTMLGDELLQNRYIRRLERLIELAEKEVERTRNQPDFRRVAEMYLYLFKENYHAFVEQYHNNIIRGFRHFQDSGQIELITCAATHGYLPLMIHPEAIRAQIQQGVRTFEHFLGRKPAGIWLPECGYKPDIDKYLAAEGIRFCFLETHCILYATPRPRYGVFAPVYLPHGVAAFGRDIESSHQVWSSAQGYPGDFDYREFYRDIGYDLDYDYIRPYLHSTGLRKMTGIKYHRITGKSDYKEVYNPDWARTRAASHADNFIFNRQKQAEYLHSKMQIAPVITAPYDAELFGHWWFEGPQFLEFLFKKLHYNQQQLEPITPSRYLQRVSRLQVVQPSEGSWGHEGFHEVWLNGSNDWIYPHLHEASRQMIQLATEKTTPSPEERRALNQAARELLLAQSSDWAFIMKTGTMVDYAIRRTKQHLNQFTRLTEMLRTGSINAEELSQYESENNLFPDLDYRMYQSM